MTIFAIRTELFQNTSVRYDCKLKTENLVIERGELIPANRAILYYWKHERLQAPFRNLVCAGGNEALS